MVWKSNQHLLYFTSYTHMMSPLFKYDSLSCEVKRITAKNLQFECTKTVHIGFHLYSIAEVNFEVCKYENVQNIVSGHSVPTSLKLGKCTQTRYQMEIANVRDE